MAPNSPDGALAKAPDAFRTISEVAEDLDLPQHVLRFWETRFTQIKPMKRGGGRRYYRPEDIELLRGIRALLYAEGFTIRGVQRVLKEKGVAFVAGMGRAGTEQPDAGHAAAFSRPEDRDGEPFAPSGAEDGAEAFYADELGEPELRQELDLRTDPGFAPPESERAPVAEEPAEAFLPERSPAPVASRTEPAAAGLSAADRRRIEFALADLLEAKRLLDQVR